MSRELAPFILLFLLSLRAPTLLAQTTDPSPTADRTRIDDAALIHAFDTRDFAAAAELLEASLRADPRNPFTHYNMACAQAMIGDLDRAAESLLDAITWGFVDFHFMDRDEHLAPLRSHPRYLVILSGWRELLDARGRADLESAQETLDSAYHYEQNPDLRLTYASAFQASSFSGAKEQVERVVGWVRLQFPAMLEAAPDKPDPWALVILPTEDDFAGLIGRAGSIGGIYDRDRKRLVTRDLGPSLRHELFHIFHWRHMDRSGQRHPYWVMEGLAALLEDIDVSPDGSVMLAPSWRTNIAKRLAKNHRLTPWSRLFDMDRPAFVGERARGNYAESRAVLYFLHDQGKLAEWYQAYTATFAEDPTGALAIEKVIGDPLPVVEADFREWLIQLPAVAEQSRPARIELGVEIGPGRGDGVEVLPNLNLESRSARPKGDRLRARDVITSINGTEVRTLDDFHRALGTLTPGDEATVIVRRGGRTVELRLTPIERRTGSALR